MILFILTVIYTVGSTHSHNPTSVNLQMEASLVVEPDDVSPSTNILKDIQDYINRIIAAIQWRINGDNEDVKSDVFSNFLRELVKALQNYDEDKLRGLARVLYLEIEKFRESELALSVQPKLKADLLKILQELAFFQPVKLKDVVEKLHNRDFTKDLVVNRFKVYFNETDKKYLDKILNRIKTNQPSDLVKTIRNALKFIVFDRFEKLPKSEKRQLKKQLRTFAELLATVKVYKSKGFKSFRKSADVKDGIQMKQENATEFYKV